MWFDELHRLQLVPCSCEEWLLQEK